MAEGVDRGLMHSFVVSADFRLLNLTKLDIVLWYIGYGTKCISIS